MGYSAHIVHAAKEEKVSRLLDIFFDMFPDPYIEGFFHLLKTGHTGQPPTSGRLMAYLAYYYRKEWEKVRTRYQAEERK